MSTALAARKEPHISATQLTTWLQCPRKYRFQYLDKLPWPSVPSALVFGTAVHAAVAELYQARLEGRDASLDEVHAVYRVAWAAEAKPIDSKEGETSEGLDAMARALLAVALEQPQRGRVLAVEEPFRIELADNIPPLIGFIDRIEEHDGRAVIVELKTAAMRFTDQRVADDLQPTAYGEAFFSALGVELAPLRAGRRPLCKACLDWSVRRSHLAGSLGAAVLDRVYALGWARRLEGERVVAFTESGEKKFGEVFGLSDV